MKIGPKYKIARRLGAPVFEKTQTQKFAAKMADGAVFKRPKSDYGIGLLEKQKARYSYGVSSGQFTKYVKNALETKGNSTELFLTALESRLDNVVLRAGLTPTRRAARQMVSHGHINVNGTRVTIPSYTVKVGDVISIRENSAKKALFSTLDEKIKTVKLPAWLKVNVDKKEFTVDGVPRIDTTELLFNPHTVLEFFSR